MEKKQLYIVRNQETYLVAAKPLTRKKYKYSRKPYWGTRRPTGLSWNFCSGAFERATGVKIPENVVYRCTLRLGKRV